MVQVIDRPNAQGIYRARVEIRDPTTGRWINKGQPSTFFPDGWSRIRVLAEIKGASRQRYLTRGRYWEGRSPSGVRIGSYLDQAGAITTAFPIV